MKRKFTKLPVSASNDAYHSYKDVYDAVSSKYDYLDDTQIEEVAKLTWSYMQGSNDSFRICLEDAVGYLGY